MSPGEAYGRGGSTVDDPFWTPSRVVSVLEHLPELMALARPARDPRTPPAPPARFRLDRDPHELETVRILADVELGLRRLVQVDRKAAEFLLRVFTGEPSWLRLPRPQRVALVGVELGIGPTEAWRCLDSARRLLHRAIIGELEVSEDSGAIPA